MQNRFIGDIGDFGKYGLLRCISKNDLRLGINWYLTDDGVDSAGNLNDYLAYEYEGYIKCDMYRELHKIVCIQNDRTVKRSDEP